MCGICGIYHLDHSRAVDEQTLTEMTRVIGHRGPMMKKPSSITISGWHTAARIVTVLREVG